jgi:hypothetical protein
VQATPRAKMRSVLRLIPPGGELLPPSQGLWRTRAAPCASRATPLQFPWPPGGELLAAPRASRGPPLQSSLKTKHAERKTPKTTKGQILTIRSRIPTGIHAATTSVAQIEFAASQNRQEVTKLDEKEADAATEIRLCTALGKKPLKFRLPLIVVFMLLNESAFRSSQPRSQASVVSKASRFASSRRAKRGRFAYIPRDGALAWD